MKKILTIFAALILLLVFAGCEYADLSYSNAEYIQDFEYMLEVLRENFPYFGIAERRFGANTERIIDNTRRALLEAEITDADRFADILQLNFIMPLRSIGHLSLQDRDVLHLILGNIYRGPIDYNGEPIYMHGRDFTYWGLKFKAVARSEAAQQFYGLIEVDLGYEYGMIMPNNVITEVLTPGEVAYIRVNQFWHYNIPHDKAIVFDFYEEIRGFDHLILDFRGNPGGFTRYFIQIFMAPNIPYDLKLDIYTLFMGGAHNLAWIAPTKDDARVFYDSELQKIPLDEMLYRFPNLHPGDAAKLDYILPHPVQIRSTGEMLFDGKIWILVDPFSASAVEYALLYAIAADFATIVGAPTRGVTGGALTAFATLPNTGLILRYDFGYFIDATGRAIDEFGVAPHYTNLPGQNALQTVMYLILNDRSYYD
ncbi:MAG: hypothetical protein LBE35_00390 [Clostridiales bacterium]|nr:hypothetical protein [Clostridiales bacterium]